MSYQIKSTPFFRRLVNTSKKNGELQKLKEEYERIKEFNDNTIQLKMREVRLKRLFREIEVIKENSMTAQAQVKRMRMQEAMKKYKTAEELRMQTLQKSKELGKEYSKLNAMLPDRYMTSPTDILRSCSSNALKESDRSKALRRIQYGNQMSNSNREIISRRSPIQLRRAKKNNNYSTLLECNSSSIVNAKETLQKRLNYGNSRSTLNMSKIPKRSASHHIATEDPSTLTPSSPSSSSARKKISVENHFNPVAVRTEEGLNLQQIQRRSNNWIRNTQECQAKPESNNKSNTPNNEDDIQLKEKCAKCWHDLSLLIRYRLDKVIYYSINKRMENHAQALPIALNHLSGCASEGAMLHAVSNDTHLPQPPPLPMKQVGSLLHSTQNMLQMMRNLPPYSDEDGASSSELVLNEETLQPSSDTYSNSSFHTAEKLITADLGSATSHTVLCDRETDLDDDNGQTTPTPESCDSCVPTTHQVKEILKKYEPMMQELVLKKEVSHEGGRSHKIRRIFEH